jgi:hypothetical protein
MAKKTKKSDKFLSVDIGIELKAIIIKVAQSQSGKSISQWVREALVEKLEKDGITI